MEEPLYVENNWKSTKKIITILVFIVGIISIGFYLFNKFSTESFLLLDKETVYFEDKEVGFSFEYPKHWGEVIVEEHKKFYDILSLKLYKFSNKEKIEIKASASGVGVVYLDEGYISTHPDVKENSLFDFCMDQLRSYNNGSPDTTYFNISEGCDTVPIGIEMINSDIKYKGETHNEIRESMLSKYYRWKLKGEDYNNLSIDINNIDVFVNNRYGEDGNVRFYPEEDRQIIKKKYQDFYNSSEGMEIVSFINSFNIFEKNQIEPVTKDFVYKTCNEGDECRFIVDNKEFYLKEDKTANSRWSKYELRSINQGMNNLLWGNVSYGESGIFKKKNGSKYLFWNDGGFGIGCGNAGMRTYLINIENLSSYRINNTSGGYIEIDKAGKDSYSTRIQLGVSKEGKDLSDLNQVKYPFDDETHLYITDSLLINGKKVYEFPEPAMFEYVWDGGEIMCEYFSSVEIRNVEIKDDFITFSVTNTQDDSFNLDFTFNFVENKLMDSVGNVLGEIGVSGDTRKVVQEKTNDVEVVQAIIPSGNCTDIDCFIEASKKCSLADYTHNVNLDFFGAKVNSSEYMKITPSGNNCELYQKSLLYNIDYPEGTPQEALDAYQAFKTHIVGADGKCVYDNISKLTLLLENIKEGNYNFDSSEPFGDADYCEGRRFDFSPIEL